MIRSPPPPPPQIPTTPFRSRDRSIDRSIVDRSSPPKHSPNTCCVKHRSKMWVPSSHTRPPQTPILLLCCCAAAAAVLLLLLLLNINPPPHSFAAAALAGLLSGGFDWGLACWLCVVWARSSRSNRWEMPCVVIRGFVCVLKRVREGERDESHRRSNRGGTNTHVCVCGSDRTSKGYSGGGSVRATEARGAALEISLDREERESKPASTETPREKSDEGLID
jgi:hypothetical protein